MVVSGKAPEGAMWLLETLGAVCRVRDWLSVYVEGGESLKIRQSTDSGVILAEDSELEKEKCGWTISGSGIGMGGSIDRKSVV